MALNVQINPGDRVYTKSMLYGVVSAIDQDRATIDLMLDGEQTSVRIPIQNLILETHNAALRKSQLDHLTDLIGSILYADNERFKRDNKNQIEEIATRIIADGWRRDPCKVGDKIFWVHDADEEQPAGIYVGVVESISRDQENIFWINAKYTCGLRYYHTEGEIGSDLYFDRDQAETELQRRKENRS